MVKDFLSAIVEYKKEEVKKAGEMLHENSLAEQAKASRSRRPFLEALKTPVKSGIHIIAEIKRASPSKGDIKINLDPAWYAAQYETGGAAAMSVLTDINFFKAGPKDFSSARKASSLPMLRKDFIISSYQVYESYIMGADAILLIARILSPSQLKEYKDLASELGMDSLVEVHQKEDLEKANQAGATLLGINNRNLSSFDTNINNAMEMAELISPSQTVVAASGISSRRDIKRNMESGISNFLIGESLVRADDPAGFLRKLMG